MKHEIVLELRALNKAFSGTPILYDLNLSVGRGEIVALSGVSGSGKTTLLRLVAGLLAPDSGEIVIGGTTVASGSFSRDPSQRTIGMVFQDSALFPHLRVQDNILFGVRGPTQVKADILRRMISLFELDGLEKRFPHELSGGQQQRVGIARALAPSPKLLLMDEGFSSLDRNLKHQLLPHLRRILHASGTSTLMVSHDADESLCLADRVVMLNKGTIEQDGNASDLYHHPANTAVAQFFGTVNTVLVNTLSQSCSGDGSHCVAYTELGPFSISGTHTPLGAAGECPARTIGFRPENLSFATEVPLGRNDIRAIPAEIVDVRFDAPGFILELMVHGQGTAPLRFLVRSPHEPANDRKTGHMLISADSAMLMSV